jgi:hypothetical protein
MVTRSAFFGAHHSHDDAAVDTREERRQRWRMEPN